MKMSADPAITHLLSLDKENNNIIIKENNNSLDEEGKPLLESSSSEDLHYSKDPKRGEVPKLQLRKNFAKEEEMSKSTNVQGGISYLNNNNNNNANSARNNNEDRHNLISDTKSYSVIVPNGETFSYGSQDWKHGRGTNFGDVDEIVRFPWKRIAYIGILLVLGVTCAILALMKLCGGADWMNRATFSVILMGTAMLLPPGLYYGRILICICFRCKEYSLWDVPVGPFG